VIGVAHIDGDAEVNFADRLADRLAHLAHDDLAQLPATLRVQLTHTA
jgi:hypothetical protein